MGRASARYEADCRRSHVTKCYANQARAASFDGDVPFGARLTLDGKLKHFQFVDPTINLRKIPDRLSKKSPQFRPKTCLLALRLIAHARTAPGLAAPPFRLRVASKPALGIALDGEEAASRTRGAVRLSSARGPYWRSGPIKRCNSP